MKHSIRFAVLAAALCSAIQLSATPIVPTSYTQVNDPWAYWDDTGTQLTDGLYNDIIPTLNLGVPTAYNWVGWSNNTPNITFNFGQEVTITSLSLSTVRWEPAAVYLPTQVMINSDTFAVTGTFAQMDKALLTFNGSWTGSTLHLGMVAGGQWTFLDEVTFDGFVGRPQDNNNNNNNNRVPEGGATAALLLLSLGLCAALRRRMHRG
jgi:hypothetical protein